MCQTAISLIAKALPEVSNAEIVLKIKGVIALFIQTMDVGINMSSWFSLSDWLLTFSSRGAIQSAHLIHSSWSFSKNMLSF